MRSLRIYLILATVAFFTSCGSDDIQLPDRELSGNIAGTSWESGSANGFLRTTNFQYLVRFLSKEELVSDPCALPVPGRAHVKAIFRPAIGSFTVSPQAIANNEVQVAFELSPSTTLIANGGFMEVFDINNQTVFGYLQATVDDENVVEGSFQIKLCN